MIIFPFLYCFFLFLSRNHLPKSFCLSVCVKKSFGAFNHSFMSIAFELTISRRFVKEKPLRLSRNRITEEPWVFSFQWKVFIPVYLSNTTNLKRSEAAVKQPYTADVQNPGKTPVWKGLAYSSSPVVSGTNQGWGSYLGVCGTVPEREKIAYHESRI